MKIVNQLKYSKEKFEDYKFSAKIKLQTKDDYQTLLIYTTDTDKNSLFKFIESITKEEVKSIDILSWSSKEQDIATTEFINEWLKDI